jgi:putative ABC transport system permease protein
MIKSYFRSAWRSLLHNRSMTLLNIAGLTIGMTAAVLIFLWVENELSFDRYQPAADRVYSLSTRTTAFAISWEGAPMRMAAAAKKEVPGIERITRLDGDHLPVFEVGDRLQYEKECSYVDDNWFDFFSYRFIEGDPAAFGQDMYGLILTASEAKKFFGLREAVGATIRIDSMNFKVKGIVADPPPNSSFQYKAYIPIAVLQTNPDRRQHDEDWGNSDYKTFIRLSPGVGPEATAARLTTVLQHYSQDDAHTLRMDLTPLKDIHFDHSAGDSIFSHGDKQVVTIFSLLGFLILVVACINYVNLTTAKASLRSKEVSIRKIVGAARRQLFLQFVAESVLVSLCSLAASLVLIRLSLPVFAELTGKDLTDALSSPAIWEVMGVTLAGAFVLNSIYPALLLSSFKPLNIFRGITVLKVKDVYLRKGLVVVQFGVSILLMTGAVVIWRQMRYIQKTNPGYDRSQVMMVSFPKDISPMQQSGMLKNKLQAIRQELLGRGGIEDVSLASQPIVNIGSMTNNGDWDGKDTSFNPKLGQLSADANLQKMLQLQLAAGRWFRADDRADERNYVLNETAARELHIHQPVIGARFKFHGVEGQIVGVVRDFRFKSLHEKTSPLVIFNDPGWWQYFFVKVAPQSAAAAVATVRDIWKSRFPGVPLEYSFLDDQFDRLYRQDAIASTLIFIFTLIAVFISLLGLFGLASFAAEQRKREIGIRKVLGASTMSIGTLLSRDFVRLVAIAIVFATPLAWWATNSWLQSFAYRVGLSWWMFGLSGVAALAMALLITGWHAVRAAWGNPVAALRSE